MTELIRYGLKWEGKRFEPVQMLDGYWTPWHVANDRMGTTSLPYITDELWEEFNETDLMTWDKTTGRPHWTQLAVDFLGVCSA
jgi:hypothetical protein|tara:strand:+ start:4985 stop:5233 length:249 start_codon:yes stop_codon:yes gene_type:complete